MQRAVPKTHDKAMENLDQKLEAKQEAIKKAEKELKHAKKVADNILIYPTQKGIQYIVIPIYYSIQYVITSIIHCNKYTLISLQAAKNGGDRAEHDKKKKAVQKWVFGCYSEMLLLFLPVELCIHFFWICL